jgi:aspartate carbamoyltransferase catalytic subunit
MVMERPVWRTEIRVSSEVPHLLDIDELEDPTIERILSLAAARPAKMERPFVTGLWFLSASLRTRVGFAVATARLGGTPVTVSAARDAPEMSQAESFADTLRTLGGMVDLVVIRPDQSLDRDLVRARSPVPVVNGGDPGGEHPTQALIDVFAMEQFAGPVRELHVGICGDLTLRAARSLLALLSRRPPLRLTLIAPPGRGDHRVALSPALAARTTQRPDADFSGFDVLLLPGLPEGLDADRLGESDRAAYALTTRTARTLRRDALVLSPMPVIDEISGELRPDPRVRIFEQSDLGVQLRMAVLRHLLDQAHLGGSRSG